MIHRLRSTDELSASRLPVAMTNSPQPEPGHVRESETPSRPDPTPIRHLLIGTPDAVQHTIHRLHNLHYAEVSFWSPAIVLPNQELILTVNPREVMRILVRSIRITG